MRDIESRLQASMHDQLDDLRLPDRLPSIRHRARRKRALFATGASLLVAALAVASAWGLNAWSGPDREQSVGNPAPKPSETVRFARFRITFRGGSTDAIGIVEIGAAVRTACIEAQSLGATSGHLHRDGQQSPVITFFDETYRPSLCVRDQDADTLHDIIDNPDDYYIEFHNSTSGGTLTARLEPAGSMLGCRDDPPPRVGTENPGFIPGQARSEGGNEVLPIVFPDGSTAELVYPTDLQLDQLPVRPDLTGGAPGEMVRPQINYGGLPFRVTGPVACIEGRDGESLPVWRWEDRENLIVLRVGEWHIAIFEGFTDLELWAQHLRGKEREGWLELNGDDELKVGPEQNPADASLMFSDADNILSMWPLDCQTGSHANEGRVENVGKAEKFTSFCIDEVNVEVHAQGQPSFVRAVAAGVQVRNLRTRFPIDHYQIVP